MGTALGIAFPSAEAVGLLGTLFVSALKAVAPVLVFFLVTSALANAKAAGSMRTVVVLYLVSMFAAALVAVASYLFPTDLTLAAPAEAQGTPSGIGEVLGTLASNMVANPVDALANANYLGILVWAVVLGIALRTASGTVKDVFASVWTPCPPWCAG
ncbi:MAG: cation:dicarboxylase symporter family transporter [Gordonibacter pamelaeae]